MIAIEIKYRSLFLLGYTRSIKGNFPDKFSELTADQLIAIAALPKGKLCETEFLCKMTRISHRIIRRLDAYYTYQLLNLFTIFNKIQAHNAFIIQQITAGSVVLHAPKAKLKGMTFGQFIFADSLFDAWAESKAAGDLHRFIAAIYLPAYKTFNEDIIDAGAECISHIDSAVADAVAINYQMVREWLCNTYPLVFVKQDDEESKIQPKKASNPNSWIKIFEALVGDDIVNQDKYASLPLHNVLRYMTERIKRNMKRK